MALLGHRAPEIEVSEWISGSPTTLGEQHGSVVLIEFRAPRCRSCAAMFGFFDELHACYVDCGLTVLTLTGYRGNDGDWAEEGDRIRQTVAEHAVDFRVGVAPDKRLQQRYGATGVPTFALVDRADVVRLASAQNTDPRLVRDVTPETA